MTDRDPLQMSESESNASGSDWNPEASPISSEEIERLRESYNSGNADDFEAYLDDLAADFLAENSDEFKRNIAAMRKSRSSSEQSFIKQGQLALFDKAKRFLLELAGLSTERHKSDVEIAKEHIQNLLTDAQSRVGEDFDPLVELGILKVGEDGKEAFVYPNDLFPESTRVKWRAYLDAVNNHLRTSNDLKMGIATPNDLQVADNYRRISHNTVSMEIKDLLGLSWDLEDARNLVTKMRENRYPNVQTGEKGRTNDALQEGMAVVRAMREHLVPNYDSLYDPDEILFHNEVKHRATKL